MTKYYKLHPVTGKPSFKTKMLANDLNLQHFTWEHEWYEEKHDDERKLTMTVKDHDKLREKEGQERLKNKSVDVHVLT